MLTSWISFNKRSSIFRWNRVHYKKSARHCLLIASLFVVRPFHHFGEHCRLKSCLTPSDRQPFARRHELIFHRRSWKIYRTCALAENVANVCAPRLVSIAGQAIRMSLAVYFCQSIYEFPEGLKLSVVSCFQKMANGGCGHNLFTRTPATPNWAHGLFAARASYTSVCWD